MSVIPDAGRLTIISSPLGDLTFTPPVTGGTVQYYEARVYAENTTTPILATKYLGLPNADPVTGLITVNMATLLNSLAAGNYDVAVAAIGPGGVGTEGVSNVFTVPLA